MEQKRRTDMELAGMPRKNKMIEFYQHCLDIDCTDMSDESKKLRAKALAKDYRLRFKNIEDLFDEAKLNYENHQANKQEKQKILDEEWAKRKEYDAIKGELLFESEVYFGDKYEIKAFYVYRRPDGTIYGTYGEGYSKINDLVISTERGSVTKYEYKPSKTIYTSGSSGGITMGGFHETKAGYVYDKFRSPNSAVVFTKKDGQWKNPVVSIKVNDTIADLFKREEVYKKYTEKGKVECYKKRVDYDKMTAAFAVLHKGDTYAALNDLNEYLDSCKRTVKESKEIVDLINRFLYGPYPQSDEQVYQAAIALSQATTSAQLATAVKYFEQISDYKDSAERKIAVEKVHDEVWWKEKEAKVIEEEKNKNKKRAKRIAKLFVVFLCVSAIIGGAISAYNAIGPKVQDLISQKDFESAYRLSVIVRSEELRKETLYEKAKWLRESGEYEEACEIFDGLGNYKDSKDQIMSTKFAEAKAYKDSGNLLEAIEAIDYDLKVANDDFSSALIEEYKTELNVWKYEYILSHKSSDDKNTYNYVKDLMKAGLYQEEMEKIQEELFSWQIEVVVNGDENDKTTNNFTFKTSEDVFVHVSAVKGPFAYSARIECTIYDSNSKKVAGKSINLAATKSDEIKFIGGIYWMPGTYTMEIKSDLDVVLTKTIYLTN